MNTIKPTAVSHGGQRGSCSFTQLSPQPQSPGSLKLPGLSFSFFPTPAVAPCCTQRGVTVSTYYSQLAAISSLQGKPKSHYYSQTSTKSNTFVGTYFVSTIYIILELVLDYYIVLRSRTNENITFCGTKQKLIRGLAHGNCCPS